MLVLVLVNVTAAFADTMHLPLEQRPDWVRRDGVVMAWSMEPLFFRVRRDGSPGYTPTPEQRAAYLREYTRKMISKLKELGVNLVMTHCYKGAGYETERESMAEAVEFSRRLREAGLRVAVYNYSGAFIWELLYKEHPQAKQWALLDAEGKPIPYFSGKTYRCFWNRNHPDAQEYYREIIRFAVEDIKADMLHFDNYDHGPGRDANSVQRFREYLSKTFSPEQLKQAGVTDINAVQPAMIGPPDNLLRMARLMDNLHFNYVINPLEMAESMAFNLDCLGAFVEFEWGQVHLGPGGKGNPLTEEAKRYARFFRARRDLFRQTDVVADVAVLRSFASQVFAPSQNNRLTAKVEDMLIANRAGSSTSRRHRLVCASN